ncbi:MAG TPA: hypothetical protein VE093_45575 [Polyangiaceae bacterium]|nr:hypothetical protein [Polyangiaceae bacterium]
MRTLDNAVKVLDAINAKIEELGEHPTLDAAKKEAEDIINAEDALTSEQAQLLRDYIEKVLDLTLNPKRFPKAGEIDNA